MIRKYFIVLLMLAGSITAANAQSTANPYSLFGIGTLAGKGLIYHKNMGGLGISNAKPWILGNINPAMLPINSFTTFDAGMHVESKTMNTSELQQKHTTGGLSYLTFGFPISTGKWTMSIGLMPYSNVSYNMNARGLVVGKDNANAFYQYKGSGGINQVYLSSGWQLIKNLLYFGIRGSYSFGSITDETTINITEFITDDTGRRDSVPKSFRPSNYYRSTRYSDFLFDGGLYLRKKIGKKIEADLGFIYGFASYMNSKRDERIEVLENVPNPPTDTIQFETRGQTYIPQKFGVGLSFTKLYTWTFGIDYHTQDWSKYKSDFDAGGVMTTMQKIIIGGEFTPDFFSVKSYLKRVTYQFGFSYEQTPVVANNKNINDIGINFGVSLPVGSASILNLGFKFGQIGTTENGLIREDYFKIRLGMVFNDRSFGWYRNQRKFN